MRIVVVAVGKLKERALREAADDYTARVRRYAKVDEVELREAAHDEVASRFARATPARARIVALDVDGQPWSTGDFARFIGRAEADGSVPAIAFFIGGSYGLPPDISSRADVRLSLSAMTLPHRLARLVLLEQIYRAFTILRGEPYSH